MATLILSDGEKLDGIITLDEWGIPMIDIDNIDVIIHKKGKETKILKSPFKKLKI